MMQCEARRSIIRITQEQHFASSASRHTPHTIPPPLRCETYNCSGGVPSRNWNILFDWRKATLTVRYVNIYYDIFCITHLKKYIVFDNKSIQPCPIARNIRSYDLLLCNTCDLTGIAIISRVGREMDWVFDFQLQRNASFYQCPSWVRRTHTLLSISSG